MFYDNTQSIQIEPGTVSEITRREVCMKLKYLLVMLFTVFLLTLNAQNAALYFDGNRDYATFPVALNLGLGGATGFTFETWIKPASLANGSPVDSYRNTIVDISLSGTNSVLAMYLRENGKIRFGGRSRNLDAFQDVVTTNPVIVTGSWQHVAGVLDFTGKKIFLYVDGALVASKETGVLFGSNTFVTMAGGSRYIGSGISLDVNHGFHGSMDEMRFWTTPRTTAEINSSMENPVSSQPYLLGYWKFDSNALDSSGYEIHGTLFGDSAYSEPYLTGLYIFAVPVDSEANVGDYVELEIRVEGFMEPMRGYEIELSIDPLYLRLESPEDISKGDLLSSNGLSQLLSTSANGVITVTETILGPCSGVTQSGSLFIIRLKTLTHTTEAGTPFSLNSAILRTPLNADIPVTELLGATVVIQAKSFLIPLHTGWNLVSSPVFPENPDMLVVFNQLISDGYLVKVQDESSHSLVFDISAGWLNSIGNWSETEGYYIQVNSDCILEIFGSYISLPLTIPLNSGWNIIPFPYLSPLQALDILAPLISAGTLIKAQDEYSVSIVYDNGWIDNIGLFETSEGYYIRVTTPTQITYPMVNKSKLSVASEASSSVILQGK